MIPENKKMFQFKELTTNGIKQLKPKTSDNNPEVKNDESGKTEIIPADIKKVMETVYGETDSAAQNTSGLRAPAKESGKTGKYDDNAIWDKRTNIKDFITETLKEFGFDVDNNPDIVNQLFLAIIQNILDKNIDIQTNISSVTELINLNLITQNSLSTIALATDLIQVLLAQKDNESSKATNEDVKKLILKELQIIINANNPDPVVPDPDPVEPEPEIPVPDEPVVIDTPQKAMDALINKIDNSVVDGNMSIKDFLLQFKAEASKYIQIQNPTYSEGFSDIIAMFLASAVSDTSGVSSGLMKDANLSAIKEKFLAFIQDLSFIDTTDGIFAYTSGAGRFEIDDIFASDHRTENGYRVGFTNADGNHDNTYDKIFAYENGEPNGALFLKFLVEFLKNDVYGGRLNSEQMKKVMEEVLLNHFGKGYASSNPYRSVKCIPLYKESVRDGVNKNKNNTIFDDLYNAMMKVANEVIKPIDASDLTSANADSFISNLFGNKSDLTASDIYDNEANYLLSNDLGVRGIIQALVDITEQYNIHNKEDYKEFLNVFIKMIYEKCGESVSGTPKLTKSILQKYFAQGNTLQDLKELIESKELRNAYFMEYILEDGGIDNELDQYGFYQKVDGDCWLVSCLHALNESEVGKHIISQAIHNNGNNSWTVRLYDTTKKPAEPKYYTITLDELMEAFGTGWYGGGDPTLMLIELATSRLRKDIDEWSSYVDDIDNKPGDKYLYMGSEIEMLRYLLGKNESESNFYSVRPKATNPNNEREQAEKIKNWILGKLNDGSIQEGTVGNYMMTISYNGHAFFVSAVDSKYIYYRDPFHPEIELKISYEELAARTITDSNKKTSIVDYITFGYAALPDMSEL